MSNELEKDRIMHLLLAEGLGRQTPPDLTRRILERAFPLQAPKPARPAPAATPVMEPEPVSVPQLEEWSSPELMPEPRGGTARRPLIFRLARPLTAAALLAITVGLLMMVVNRNRPSPYMTGEYTVAGGGAVVRGAEVSTDARTARLSLAGVYVVDMNPHTRVRIEGSTGDEELRLMEGDIACNLSNDNGDLKIKTEAGTVHAIGARFQARVIGSTSIKEGENMMTRKLVVNVLAGLVTVAGSWGQATYAAGHEQTFLVSGPVAAAAPQAGTVARGTLVQVVDNGLTLQTGTVTDTIHFDDTPQVKINDKPATLADLKPGMSVVVEGTSTGTVIIASVPHASTTQTAPPAITTVTGTITQVRGDGVTVHASTGSVNFAVTTATVIRIKDALATLADLKTGMSIAVITVDGKTAKEIHAYPPTTTPTPAPPATATVTGSITQVRGDGVTVHTSIGSVNFAVTTATVIRIKDALATLADLKVGMSIAVISTDGKTAKEIHAYPPTTTAPTNPPTTQVTYNVTGSILQVTGNQVSIKSGGKTVILTITTSTIIRIKDVAGTLADLKPGMSIGAASPDGKTATQIVAYVPNTTTQK